MDTLTPSETTRLNELIRRFSPFINEIRRRVIFTIAIFVVATIAGFIFYEQIIRFIINLLSLQNINLVFTSPFQFINLAVSCGIATGLVTVFPLLIHQTLSFLKPALKQREYRIILRFLPFSILLFIIGFAFGIIIMKWHIQLFLSRSVSIGIGNVLDISQLISTVVLISTFMGIVFQFPIILLLLSRLDVVSHKQLSKYRKFVYIVSILLVIFLPLSSVFSDFLLTLPIVVLYELTLLSIRIQEKRRAVKQAQAKKAEEKSQIDTILRKLEKTTIHE